MTFGLSAAAVAGIGAAATVGVGMYSANKQAGAIGDAADAQLQSAQMGIDEQRRQFDAVQKLLNPYVQAATGTGKYTPLTTADLIDTSAGDWKPNADLYANNANYRNAWDAFYTGHQQQFGRAPNLASGSDLAAVQNQLSGAFDLNAYNKAQEQAWNQAQHTKGSLIAQQDLLGLNGADAQQQAINGIQSSPMFTALQQQGENSILQNASATGGLRGGNTESALAQFRPQVLAQLITDQYSKLGGLTALGQNAAAGVGNAGIKTGSSISDLFEQQGAAQAGAALASGRAAASIPNSIANGVGLFAGLGGFKGLGATTQATSNGYITGGPQGASWTNGYDLPNKW